MKQSQNLITGAAANGASEANLLADAKSAIFYLHTTSSTTATIKFVASFQKDKPDFSSPSIDGNDWHYVQVLDIDTGAGINGTTGIPLSAATLHKAYALNLEGATYLGAIVSGATGGGIEVSVMTEDAPLV